MAHTGKKIRFGEVGFLRHQLGALQLDVGLLKRLLDELALGDVARGGEHALENPVAVVEGGGVVGHIRCLAVAVVRGEFIVGDSLFSQHQLDGGLGPLRIGEIVPKLRADQLVVCAASKRLHLLVRVGDSAQRIREHQRIHVRLDERACVELVIAQALIELLLLCLHPFASRVVGADQQISDDGIVIVAQGRDRHDRWQTAAVLANIGQFVDIFDLVRGLEHQRLEARSNRGSQLLAQRLGAHDDFHRIGNPRWRKLVHDLSGRVAQHALCAHVEDLNDALRIGGDTREISAVEDRALQDPRLEQHLFPSNLGDDSQGPCVVVGNAGIVFLSGHTPPPSFFDSRMCRPARRCALDLPYSSVSWQVARGGSMAPKACSFRAAYVFREMQ